MKYIKLKDFTGKIGKDECLLMSNAEFNAGGKEIKGVPVSVTPNGEEPKEEMGEHEI